jgi:tetratricopeptide (TPR) repeat protein
MRLIVWLTITIALAVPLQAQNPAPPSHVDAQVKQELIEAAEAFRAGNYAAAQAHSERALLLDPQNQTAPYFVARTIHAQYKPGIVTPENLARAREAIIAYRRVLERSPADEEAYKAVAYLYGAIQEYEQLRQWLLQRATNVAFAADKRAEAFVVLASKDWDCSFEITEQPTIKIATVRRNKSYVRYQMPKDRVEFEQARECANRGLEMVNTAITLTPEYESAWAYKTNILLELEKLAEMLGDVQHKRELHRQYDEALKETTRLSQRAQSNP